jgi:hypothetical protein
MFSTGAAIPWRLVSMFATNTAARWRLASMFAATGDATRRCLTFMLSSIMHIVDDLHMDDELFMAMASAHGYHLLAASDATYRAACRRGLTTIETWTSNA